MVHEDVSITEIVNSILQHAYTAHASDIHIDPSAHRVRVRVRIDGILSDIVVVPKKIQHEIVSRIKVLAGLRLDVQNAAQDGRFRMALHNQAGTEEEIDIRVSVIPAHYGEKTVLRLLTQPVQAFTLESLGFSGPAQELIQRALHKPYGMILATGPNGSGKTTTLYTLIKILNTPEMSMITIEDPIEYAIEDINQIPTNSKAGLTFASGLRSILRQDPNVIMVGEIRDEETASIATNAALTGHILLSTLHANDAPSAFTRLLDLQVPPFLIASTINIILGQRLVRKICAFCKTPKSLTPAELASLQGTFSAAALNKAQSFFVGRGCEQCNSSGYEGRVGIQEVLGVSEAIRSAIMQRANASDIKKIALSEGMVPMLEDGLTKAAQGITTIEEILRVARE